MAEPYRLVFVCSGNICRSPMAEVLAVGAAARRGLPVEARSCGTLLIEDHPADPEAVAVCAEVGLDLSGHLSQGAGDAIVAWADWLLCMETKHARWLRERWPDAEDRIVLLGTFGGGLEIADPIGGPRSRFRASRDEIGHAVDGFLARLAAPRAS